jgi:hypothetical protein
VFEREREELRWASQRRLGRCFGTPSIHPPRCVHSRRTHTPLRLPRPSRGEVSGQAGAFTRPAGHSTREVPPASYRVHAPRAQGLLEGLLEESDSDRRAAQRWPGNCVDGLPLGEWSHPHTHHAYHALIHPCGVFPLIRPYCCLPRVPSDSCRSDGCMHHATKLGRGRRQPPHDVCMGGGVNPLTTCAWAAASTPSRRVHGRRRQPPHDVCMGGGGAGAGGDNVGATTVRTVTPRQGRSAPVYERAAQFTPTCKLEPGLPVRQLALEAADAARARGASPVVAARHLCAPLFRNLPPPPASDGHQLHHPSRIPTVFR